MTPEKQGPTALQAAGAQCKITIDCVLRQNFPTKTTTLASLTWSRVSGSIERLDLVRREGLA